MQNVMKQQVHDIMLILDDAFKAWVSNPRCDTVGASQHGILHIVLIPELAFDGHIKQFELTHNAEYPQPEVVENKLTDKIHKKLQTYCAHLRVTCAFSVASYLDMQFEFDNSGVDNMESADRMTVLTSTPKLCMHATKFSPSSTDGCKDDLSSGLVVKSINRVVRPALEDGPKGLAHLTEIKLDLIFFGKQGESNAFGTCLDAFCDRTHGGVDLVVILGCGRPLIT